MFQFTSGKILNLIRIILSSNLMYFIVSCLVLKSVHKIHRRFFFKEHLKPLEYKNNCEILLYHVATAEVNITKYNIVVEFLCFKMNFRFFLEKRNKIKTNQMEFYPNCICSNKHQRNRYNQWSYFLNGFCHKMNVNYFSFVHKTRTITTISYKEKNN